MSDRRSQGRPCRGEAEVGKEKILAALRDLLRSDRCQDLSRKTVAAHAGVTPALISYYFAKKERLLLEAVAPVIGTYADEICLIADMQQPADAKVRQVITILIRLYKRDGRIFDIYRDVAGRGDPATDQIVRITSALSRIFDPDEKTRATLNLDALILQGAIWGMCRFAAQAEENAIFEDDEPYQERLPSRLAATLMSFVGRAPALSGLCAMPTFSSAAG